MNLLLVRHIFNPKFTIGKLYVNNIYECDTLERTDRYLERGNRKIPGATAIPPGDYDIIIDKSENSNDCLMPHILNVPQFSNIKVHSDSDTDIEGGILVGRGSGRSVEMILNSRECYRALYPKIEAALQNGENVRISIKREDNA